VAVLTSRHGDDEYHHLYACPVDGSCREVKLPARATKRQSLLDVARVGRSIVVAWSREGLVRVTTTRDEGPAAASTALVFDARDANLPGLDTKVVPTLLRFGRRLELSLSVPGGNARWSLVSDDGKASFRSP
jgi:hypothetical protein